MAGLIMPWTTGAFSGRNIRDEYIGTSVVSTTGSYTTLTLSSVNLGPGPTKIVSIPSILACVVSGNIPLPYVTSATIAGVSATVYRTTASDAWEITTMLVAQGVNASTGDIVLTYNRTVTSFSGTSLASVHASVYSSARTGSFTFTQSSRGGTTGAVSVTANAADNPDCFVVVGSMQNTIGGSITGTGLNLDSGYDYDAYTGDPKEVWQGSASRSDSTSSFTVSIPSGSYRSLACLTCV